MKVFRIEDTGETFWIIAKNMESAINLWRWKEGAYMPDDAEPAIVLHEEGKLYIEDGVKDEDD